jgi:phosphoglycolate phosphatase-like HAD superfamily hydrolase
VIRWDAIRCVVFDFDGTLVESNAIKRDSYFEILAETPGGPAVVEGVLRENPGADRYAVLALAHAALASRDVEPLPTAEALVDAYSRLCEERVAECPPLPCALQALSSLRATHALYLDSATPTDALERVVEKRGWRKFFRGVLGGPASKLENLQWIAERERLGAGQMVYIGDGVPDREAAAGFGCGFFGFEAPPRGLADAGPLARLVAEIASRSAG